MAIGYITYLAGATLLIFIREHTSYWKLLLPALIVTVLGADFQFIVSNVSCLPLYYGAIKSLIPFAAIRNETNAEPIFPGCWCDSNHNAYLPLHRSRYFHCRLRFFLVYAREQEGHHVPSRARLFMLYFIRSRWVIMCSIHADRDAGWKDTTSI